MTASLFFYAFILRGSEGPLGSDGGTDVEGLREERIVLHPQLGTDGEIELVRHADKLIYIAPYLRLGTEDHPTASLIGAEVGPQHGKAADGPDAIPTGPGGIAPELEVVRLLVAKVIPVAGRHGEVDILVVESVGDTGGDGVGAVRHEAHRAVVLEAKGEGSVDKLDVPLQAGVQVVEPLGGGIEPDVAVVAPPLVVGEVAELDEDRLLSREVVVDVTTEVVVDLSRGLCCRGEGGEE